MLSYFDFIVQFPVWGKILLGQVLLFTIPTGMTFLFLYKWPQNPFHKRKIQPFSTIGNSLSHEIRHSFQSSLIFAINGFLIYIFASKGWTLIYSNFSDYTLLYWSFSVLILIVLHDAYFYWTHRFMHHRLIFNAVHRIHHECTSPSPWAAYAFSPIEAIIQAVFLTLVVFVLPLHPTAIYVFMAHMIVRNILGHSGYEVFPSGTIRHKVLCFLTTNTHHDLHHSSKSCNYGLYFTWWDILINTEHPKYSKIFNMVVRNK